jgi:hypothetical protein
MSTVDAATSSIMDSVNKTFSDCLQDEIGLITTCLQDEFDLLVFETTSSGVKQDIDKVAVVPSENRDDDNVDAPLEPDQVSLLQSVGTTINRRHSSFLTEINSNGDDDERTDFLSERQVSLVRIPSKIAFKPRGRSYVLQVGEYDLVPVREGTPEEIFNGNADPIPRPCSFHKSASSNKSRSAPRLLRRKESSSSVPKEKAVMATSQRDFLDPAEVVVQGRNGVEILATTNGNRRSPPPTIRKSRWGLGRLSLRSKSRKD